MGSGAVGCAFCAPFAPDGQNRRAGFTPPRILPDRDCGVNPALLLHPAAGVEAGGERAAGVRPVGAVDGAPVIPMLGQRLLIHPYASAETHAAPKARTPREGTKQATLIAMLRAPEGATIEEITAATEWQSHTVRGAMSGVLKKKLGLEVTSEKVEGRGRVYRLPPA